MRHGITNQSLSTRLTSVTESLIRVWRRPKMSKWGMRIELNWRHISTNILTQKISKLKKCEKKKHRNAELSGCIALARPAANAVSAPRSRAFSLAATSNSSTAAARCFSTFSKAAWTNPVAQSSTHLASLGTSVAPASGASAASTAPLAFLASFCDSRDWFSGRSSLMSPCDPIVASSASWEGSKPFLRFPMSAELAPADWDDHQGREAGSPGRLGTIRPRTASL